MKRIAITGGSGFIGTHLQFYLHEYKSDYEWVLLSTEDFSDEHILKSKISDCDVLVHLAGLNRGDEDKIYDTNIGLMRNILSVCAHMKTIPKIIFLSSSHNVRDTAYGRSKRDCEAMLSAWGEQYRAEVVSIVSPNVFGPFAKPNHNTFVATFCNDIIQGRNSEVNKTARVSLIYVRDVCASIFNLINSTVTESRVPLSGVEITVLEVYEILKQFYQEYNQGIIPKLTNELYINLFNTLRSYTYPEWFPVGIDVKRDERGFLFEIVKGHSGGQTFFSETNPGVTRGNHYHTRKIERFCVLAGEACIRLRKLYSSDVIEYNVSGTRPVYIDMPIYYTHSIENVGNTPLHTMFWSNEIFNPNDPDTFIEKVML